MPFYQNNPFTPPIFLMEGVPAYLFGSLNLHQGNTVFQVSQVALTSNVATVTGQIVAGEVPVVGALISVQQTVSGSGEFNVNRAKITAVSINNSGAGTISYALAASNVTAVADFGTAIVEVPEIPDTLANGSSIAAVVQAPDDDSDFTLPYAVTFPTVPTAATVVIQAAIKNIDSEFTTLQTVASVASSTVSGSPFGQVTLQRGYIYRFNVSGLSGSGSIVAKIG